MKRLLCIMFILTWAVCINPDGSAQENIQSTEIDETQFRIEDPETLPLEGPETASLFSVWDFVRMLLIMGAIIGVIYLIFHFLKKAGGPKKQESQSIKVLSSQSLGSGKNLHLIEIGTQIYLIGAAENSVSLVSQIQDKETLDILRLQGADQGNPEKRNFADLFTSIFKRDEGAVTGKGPASLSSDFLRRQRERIKKL